MRNLFIFAILLMAGCGPSADEICKEAREKYLKKNTLEAFSDYKRALEINPRSSEAYNGIGNCYNSIDKPDEAIKAYKKAIELDRNNDRAYINIAREYAKKKDFLEALHNINKAISITPNEAEYLLYKSMMVADSGDLKESLIILEHIVKKHPESFEPYELIGRYTLKMAENDNKNEVLLMKAKENILTGLTKKEYLVEDRVDIWMTDAYFRLSTIMAHLSDNTNNSSIERIENAKEAIEYIKKGITYTKDNEEGSKMLFSFMKNLEDHIKRLRGE